MKVMCTTEYWEHGVKLRKAGAIYEMTPELFELYSIFVKKIEPAPPKRVAKPAARPTVRGRGDSIR